MIAVAAFLFGAAIWRSPSRDTASGLVRPKGLRFVIDGQPFRFVGANVAIMYRDEDRARMPETFRQASQA